jgi:predicted permease
MSRGDTPPLYRLLLRLFPAEFRRAFGPDMEQLFRDRLRETAGRPGARLRLWALAVLDASAQAAVEWSARFGRTVGITIREGTSMEGWIQDLRFAARTLSRRPRFTTAAVVTLALGIGANVSIFSVVNGVLLRPLPYPDADRLVVLETVNDERGTRGTAVDHPDVRVWQEQVPDFRVAGYAPSSITLTELGEPEAIDAVRVTDGLLTLLDYPPLLGRDLRASDDVPDGPRVAVVSHAFWSERLGRDSGALGRMVTLDGDSWEIVGVAPADFDYPSGADVWLPRRHQAEGCGHGCRVMRAIGKLDAGMSLEAAQARFDAVSANLAADFPDEHMYLRTELRPLLDYEVADVRSGLWVLLGSVAMVLLIACANVANLMLARAGDRRGEVALRATLGAGRARIARQLLTESALLAAVAGVLGIALSAWGTGALVALAPDDLPRLDDVGLDVTALGFGIVLVIVVTGLFGVIPAAQLTRQSLGEAMGGVQRATQGKRAGTSRSLLLVGEVALSLSLLLGAGLLFRTLVAIRAVDLGFAIENVERFRISIPDSRYDSLGGVRFFDELESRLTALPGVEAAGTGFGVPLASGNIGTSVIFLDRPPVPEPDQPSLAIRPSSPGYLDAAGITLVRGRWFTSADRHRTEGVAVINQATTDLYYPDVDPIGRRLELSVSWSFGDDPERTVVGIVGDVRGAGATAPPEPAVYIPNAQFGMDAMFVYMKLGQGVASVMPDARKVLSELDPALAVRNVERIETVVVREHASAVFYVTLLSAFSLLALVLAAVGLYGVVSYVVSRRTREIGIRMALGAASDDVVGMVLSQGARPALLGIVLGLAASALGERLLGSLLYGVAPYDPLTLLTATGLLGLVVLAAIILPARRAARIPAASALRTD